MIHCLLLSAVALGAGQDQDEAAAPARAVELLSNEALAGRLRSVASAHPDLATVYDIGRSRTGAPIHALRLTDGDPSPGRPAILLVANVEGPHVFSSGVALWLAEELADRRSTDERVRTLLETTTLYVVPRANPDGAAARFASPLAEMRATGHGVDDDRDGRAGEDGPSDVDGDGLVTWMRRLDPEGEWIADPHDERVMVRADASLGEAGRYVLSREGRDGDGDERVAEDPLHDAHVDRNFPQDWEEHTARAGLFPTDEPEALALAEFLLLHEDVALALTWGSLDDLAKAPKGVKDERVKRVPRTGVLEEDAKLYAELGRRYAKAVESPVEGSTDRAGTWPAWVYAQRGILSLSVRLWDIPLDAKAKDAGTAESEDAGAKDAEDAGAAESEDEPAKPDTTRKPTDDAKRLVWIDSEGADGRFVPWREHEHPELGPVEIGGFAPYARIEPPEADRAPIAAEQLEFLLGLGEALPRVRLEATAVDLGGGLVKVEATLVNDALLPLVAATGRRTRAPRPARVQLVLPDGAELVAGRSPLLVRELAGSGGRESMHWLVQGAPADAIGVRVDTDHAGTATARAEVK